MNVFFINVLMVLVAIFGSNDGELFQVTDVCVEDCALVEAVPLSGNTKAIHGYLLDNKYVAGSIVYVEFIHDDIYKEVLIKGAYK